MPVTRHARASVPFTAAGSVHGTAVVSPGVPAAPASNAVANLKVYIIIQRYTSLIVHVLTQVHAQQKKLFDRMGAYYFAAVATIMGCIRCHNAPIAYHIVVSRACHTSLFYFFPSSPWRTPQAPPVSTTNNCSEPLSTHGHDNSVPLCPRSFWESSWRGWPSARSLRRGSGGMPEWRRFVDCMDMHTLLVYSNSYHNPNLLTLIYTLTSSTGL
jgi:hypothetical protein